MLLLLALLACTPDVRGLYERERAEVLERATEVPADWRPDVTLAVADDDFAEAVRVALRAALGEASAPIRVALPLGARAEVRPRLEARTVDVRPSDACAACVAFAAELDGHAAWSVAGLRDRLPIEVSARGVLALDVQGGRAVRARLHELGRVDVKVRDLGALRANPSKELQGWAEEALRERLPPVVLFTLDDDALPVRDLRLRTSAAAVTVELLSDVPGARPVGAVPPPERGVRLLLAESALVGVARRAAFEAGPVAMDVAVDPRALDLEGDRFTLDLRLWRLVGRGWWRDYRVTGTLRVRDGRVRLLPDAVEPTGKSAGAALVDPLALLAEGAILDAISDAVARSLPARHGAAAGAVRFEARATAAEGRGDTLVVDGKLDVVAR